MEAWGKGQGGQGGREIWSRGREGIPDPVPQVCVVSREREFTSGHQEDTLQLVQGSSGFRRGKQLQASES